VRLLRPCQGQLQPQQTTAALRHPGSPSSGESSPASPAFRRGKGEVVVRGIAIVEGDRHRALWQRCLAALSLHDVQRAHDAVVLRQMLADLGSKTSLGGAHPHPAGRAEAPSQPASHETSARTPGPDAGVATARESPLRAEKSAAAVPRLPPGRKLRLEVDVADNFSESLLVIAEAMLWAIEECAALGQYSYPADWGPFLPICLKTR